jgi:hypothetical protein
MSPGISLLSIRLQLELDQPDLLSEVHTKIRESRLALQLPTCFEMRALSGGLVSSAPE